MAQSIDPIFISVKEAAKALDTTPQTVYALLDKQLIESRYQGRLRKVVVASLRDYAANLPTAAPVADDEVA